MAKLKQIKTLCVPCFYRFFFSFRSHSRHTLEFPPLMSNARKFNFSLFIFTFQVSTSTGVVSHFVNVQVVVPEAFILGSGELHVDMGSAINLVCIIEKVSVLSLLLTCVVSAPSHVLCVCTNFPIYHIAKAFTSVSLFILDTNELCYKFAINFVYQRLHAMDSIDFSQNKRSALEILSSA